MRKCKRAGAWLLAAALTIGLLPAAGAAVSSDNAKSYLKVLDDNPDAHSYLVDFDGDGADELVLIETITSDEYRYEVYTGGKRVANEKTSYQSMGLYQKSGATGYFIGVSPKYGDASGLTVYTFSGSKWVEAEDISEAWIDTKHHCRINGKDVSPDELKKAENAYRLQYWLDENAAYHTVRNQLANAVDTSVSGYEDVLNTLSASEQKALFDDLLTVDMLKPYDFRTVSDEILMSYMTDVYGGFYYAYIYPAGDYNVFALSDLTRLTQQLFARTIDYDNFPNHSMQYIRDGQFYHFWGGRGGPGVELRDRHLYALGNGHYWATYEYWIESGADPFALENIYGSLVRQNADGSWTLRGNFLLSDVADPTAFTKPSGWAKSEIDAAQSANLIPKWTNPPLWTDEMTRLQFAELIVQFIEQATGKTLEAAPSGTFTDTTSQAVRKAYAAGIVNGTSATAFSPFDALTREQLATMLWRAVSYVQTETGKTALSAGGSLSGYADASKVSSWAKDAVAALAQNGVMKGTSATRLSPAERCTVEQSVLLVYRTDTKLQMSRMTPPSVRPA